jgi:hypothetical protein
MNDQVLRAAQLVLVAIWLAVWVYYAYLLVRANMHRRPGSYLWRFFRYRELGKYPLPDESFMGPGLGYYRRARSCIIPLIVIMALGFLLRRARVDACHDAGGRWHRASCEYASTPPKRQFGID